MRCATRRSRGARVWERVAPGQPNGAHHVWERAAPSVATWCPGPRPRDWSATT
ncbi:hypothetical protein PIB30_103964, partial [Stylosanthes scabra]|nr:hypothetical protein [Stylosanthes scabra]